MMRNYRHLAAIAGFATLLCVPSTTWAQVAPPLGVAARFGVLGRSGVTGSTGTGTAVSGDVGSSPTATITNFPPSTAVPPFIVHNTNDGVVQQARSDANAAFTNLLNQGPGTVLPDNLATVGALGPGIYSFVSGAPDLPAGATLTLNDPTGIGIFVFNVGSSLTANVLSNVVGTANPCNIYWRVGSSATLNGTTFRGTVIASASITIGAGANLAGRALAGAGATGAVTMAGSGGNTIGVAGCAGAAPPVCPAITLSPATLPNGTVGVPFSQTITASPGTAPFTFSVTPPTLPAGLTLTSAGVLAGTPTTAETQTFTIVVTDAAGCLAQRTFTVTIVAAGVVLPPPGCPLITLAPTTLPNFTVGVAYSQTITASGGTAPFTFTKTTSGPLPPGLTLTSAGVVSGTPASSGIYDFTIRGTDANACFAELAFTLSGVIGVPTLPQVFVLLLALGLIAIGYVRLRRRERWGGAAGA